MGKVVMPKNSALLNEIEAVLQIYYEAGDWLPNEEYKTKLKAMIGDDQYSSSYTKKAQITSYFGFTVSRDLHTKRITESGKIMYEAIKANDKTKIQDVLMRALETVKFGRDNDGCPDSNTDVEPPSLFVRASLDLGYLTYREFAYLLWKLEDVGGNYTDSLSDIREFRNAGQVDLGNEAQKYTDAKPIMILVRWGFLAEDDDDSTGGKHIIVDPVVKSRFEARLKNLKIYNIDKSDADFTLPVSDATMLTPEWFNEKAKEFVSVDSEAAAMYIDFNSRFGVNALSALSGEDLLKTMFLGASSDNLCHEIEYVSRNTELFGSVKGGNAYKYPMFFDKEASMWTSGTRTNPKQLSLDEAIIKGTSVRDGLVKGAGIIKNALPVDSVEDYLTLYTELYAVIPDLVDSLWVIKYYHMLFPELIPVFYNKDWQIRVLTALNITPNDTAYGRLGQINAFVKECEITNVAFARVFHKYCRNISVDEGEDIGLDEVVAPRVTGGTNIILYGVPGAGKSWTIKHEYCDDESRMERLVFHPDYTYSDFVGQILPKVGDDGSVSYEFSAGPFTKLVRKAYINPDKMYYLVIEEVNRGNAPAIFGDVFQLLDRDNDGASEYEITNADIAKIVYLNDSHKVSIPSNMCILCTMNTSDQNVFTLDTAFQRRWSMRLIKNRFHDEANELRFAGTKILDTDVTWQKFFTEINDFILGKNIRMTSSEDKRLGTHFVSEDDLRFEDGNERQNSRFAEKVLKYLWDDAFKFTKEDVFDLEKVKSLEDVIELFVYSTGNARFLVFKENIYNSLVPKNNA
jgi:MoxR-like ATPase